MATAAVWLDFGAGLPPVAAAVVAGLGAVIGIWVGAGSLADHLTRRRRR